MDLTWEDRQRAFQAKVLTEGVSEEFAIGVRPYRTFVGAATGTPPPAGSRLERALIVVIAGAAIAATLVLLGGPRTIVAGIAGLTGGVAMFAGLAGPDPRTRHDLDEPLLTDRDNVSSILIVVLTSDRGLCGAFNSSVLKRAQRASESHKPQASSLTAGPG